jgi:hypothetical protein
MLDVANINFQCCGCWISILQTCGIRCCVEEEEGEGLLMFNVARNTNRNMGRLGIMLGEEGESP